MTICTDENISFEDNFKLKYHHDLPGTFYLPYFLTFSSHRTVQELNNSFLCAFGCYPEVSGPGGEGSCAPASTHPEPLPSDPPKIGPSQDHQEGTQACGPHQEQMVSVDPRKMT